MRKLLFQIHLWTGLILFLPLVALGLSGSALVVFEFDGRRQGAGAGRDHAGARAFL